MAVKESKAADFTVAKEFIATAGKTVGNVTTVAKGDYYGFMRDQGLPREVVDGVAEQNRALAGAAIEAAADRLAPAIAEAKAAGNDPSDLTHMVKIQVPGGQDRFQVKAASESRNPTSGEVTTRHGTVRVVAKRTTGIPGEAEDYAQKVIEAAIKG